MGKTDFIWQEYGSTWKGVGIYHVTLTIPTRQPLLGTLVIPDGDPSRARVERSKLGERLVKCVFTIPDFHPEIRILQFCLMPDHLHIVLYVTRPMPIGIRAAVRGFWQAAKQIGREYLHETSLIIPNVIRGNEQSSTNERTIAIRGNEQSSTNERTIAIRGNEQSSTHEQSDAATVFTEKPFIRVMSRSGQLPTMIRYVQLNPVRLATKRLHPGFFHVMRKVEVSGRQYDAVGNIAILMTARRATVHVHKKLVMDAERHGNTQPLRDYKNGCVLQARQGVVMVSPFVSPHEQEVERVLINEKHPIIVLLDNGFRDYYKPTDLLFEACSEGRVLLLAPTHFDAQKQAILRAECVHLNSLADEIARAAD